MDEMIKRFNNFAAEMNIPIEDKMTLLVMITEIDYTHEQLLSDFRYCRNELCLKCGDDKQRHLGACDGGRWRSE